MWSCFKPSRKEPSKRYSKDEKGKQFVPASGFHNDIVYYKFLNADTYELDVIKIQVWIFDKNQICVHASDNEFKADFYVGKHLSDVILKEDVLDTFKDIHTLALSGIESKRTVMINNLLAYIEGRTLYYNEDINDVYGSMLVFIPYKNVIPATNRASGGSSTYVLKDSKKMSDEITTNTSPKASSLDNSRLRPKKREIKRTLSDSKLNSLQQEKDKESEFDKKKDELLNQLANLISSKQD
jgi:hypothetical protein